MCDTIIHAAGLLRVPLVSADGSERVTGHSLRSTGAQGLAGRGLDPWAIQLLGRWGSDAVRLYLREAEQEGATIRAAATAPLDLDTILDQLVKRLDATGALLRPDAVRSKGATCPLQFRASFLC